MARIWPRIAVLAIAGGGLFTATASAHRFDVVGHVYVNDNTASGNTIVGFDRHADGTLTPLAGSPFTAGGAGTGAGIGSQGALQVSDDGRYLLAVDAGSNEISVLRIRHDGDLALRGVVPSGGIKPVSIAVNGDLVYVANAGDGASNYTGFRLHDGGALVPLAGSTVSLPDGSQPGDVLFNSTGSNLVGARVGTSLIDSFSVGRNGRLTAAAGSPFPAQGPGPFGSEFRPTNPAQLFVSNAHGGAGNGTVSAFAVGRDGALTSIGSSPFADFQTAPCWVEISHDGRYLFTVNTGSASISTYAITPRGALDLLGSTPLEGGTALGSEDARLAPDGRTLWIVDSKADAITGLSVRGATLLEFPDSPTALPLGAAPFGVVVN
ncbi:MAG TPA: beta-propeller fold lactonase family protein [Solirubrobacteraceae bacterium]|nr:beta-propeller fold lactonase family protein [Solirubrobacteraceae bacterium]